MAVPNTLTSDLDRTNATIALFAAHLQQFSQECEQPHSKPGMREALQQLRLDEVNKYLDKIRKDLDSVRGHFQSSVANSEQDAADQKKKRAELDRAIEAAEKKEERLDRAILFVREEKAEVATKKAEAVVEKAEAEKKMEDAEKMRADADKKMADAEKMMQADQSIRESIDRLSDVSRELAEVSAEMGRPKTATQAAKTSTSKIVADLNSTGKRPLSSGVEPTGKRARSLGPVLPTGIPLDKEPGANISGIQLIIPSRFRLGTSVTPRPSCSSNEPSLLDDPADIYGLRPGSGICPDGLRDTNDEIQRTWAQIAFGAEWTQKDSDRLLEEFNKYAAKGVLRQMPQKCLDRCASAEGSGEKCLLQDMLKKASEWYDNEDATTQQCVHCSRRFQFCIRVAFVDLNPGEYDKDATNEKRWNITKRQL